ncbi:hypothetical protein ABMA79_08010 [Halobacteriovorax sp. HFRX-2_2]|uniref:hypothetical protein n=1 Tax=unclassified Halobacteriovorax TaxID=2639665 RepID=UPI003713340F
MFRSLLTIVITIAFASSVVAQTQVPAEFEKINTYKEMKNYAQDNFAANSTCMDEYHQRVRKLRKDLLMQPVKLTLGLVQLPIVATLGGFVLGGIADGGPITEFGEKILELLDIDLTETIDAETAQKIMDDLGIKPIEAIQTGAGAGIGALGIVLIYNTVKMGVISSKIIATKNAAKMSFTGYIGGGKKFDKLVAKINKRVNRALKKEGLEEVEVAPERISELLVEADQNSMFCTGELRKSKSAKKFGAPLRKRLAKKSDIYRYLRNTILAEYGITK